MTNELYTIDKTNVHFGDIKTPRVVKYNLFYSSGWDYYEPERDAEQSIYWKQWMCEDPEITDKDRFNFKLGWKDAEKYWNEEE